MSDSTDPQHPQDDGDDETVRDLLKQALPPQPIARAAPDILRGVQQRLRARSRGKFFADGWSTTQARTAYVLAAVATLLLVAVALYALAPFAFR